MLAPSKPSPDPTNHYNQAWQSSAHFKSATWGHTVVMHPHYHVGGNMSHRQSFRFGSPIPSIASFQQPFYQWEPERQQSDLYNWNRAETSSPQYQFSQCAPKNVGGGSRQHFEMTSGPPDIIVKEGRWIFIKTPPQHNPAPSSTALPSGSEVYVKDGRQYFVKTPPQHSQSASPSADSVPMPPITPVSEQSSTAASQYSPADYIASTPEMSPFEVNTFQIVLTIKCNVHKP